MDLDRLIEIVTAVADRELLPRFHQVERQFKADGSIVTEADLAMQQCLTEALDDEWPEIELLGEEMEPQRQQELLKHSSGGLWVLDPLDGSSNFASGFPCFSVSLALVQDGQPQLGVVYDPLRRECFSASRSVGSWLNGVPIRCNDHQSPALQQSIALVDLKRLGRSLAAGLVAAPPYRSQRNPGSIALEWCYLAAGRGQIYLHGAQNLWDYGAGWLICQEAGGYSARLDGKALWPADLQPVAIFGAVEERLFQQWQAYLTQPCFS